MKHFDRNDRNRNPGNNRKFSHGGNFQKQAFGRVQKNKPKHPQQRSQQQQQQQQHLQKQQKPRKLPPITPKKLCFHWQEPKHVGPGLTNGQNTCFLNSVLQCLSYTPALAQYLLTGDHQRECQIRSRQQGFCALCAMERHVDRVLSFNNNKRGSILPSYFTGNLKALSPTLRLYQQEDAHEFLTFLFNAFQKSILFGRGKVEPKVEESTWIHQIFGGKLRSQLRCHGCKATSNTYQALLDLSVDLHKATTIYDALKNFIAVDPIDGYKCEKCKKTVRAGKQMMIDQPPAVLNLHLKRFTFDMMSGRMRKVSTRIRYPEVLDLAPFVSGQKEKPLKYRLYGVLVHMGSTCGSGHYYAYVKSSDNRWYCMDDEDVRSVPVKQVMDQQAYILFYTRDTAIVKNNLEPSAATDVKPQAALATASAPAPVMNGDIPKAKQQDLLSDKENTRLPIISKEKSPATSKTDAKPSQPVPQAAGKDSEVSSVDSDESASSIEIKTKKRKAPEQSTFEIFKGRLVDWQESTVSDPYISIRGGHSPPTLSAALSDPMTWKIRDLGRPHDGDDSSPPTKRPSKPWLKKARWTVTPN